MESTLPKTSGFRLRILSFIFLAVAILLSIYLTYEKFTDANAPCIDNGAFDCGTVLNSVYSEIAGVPIALLGLITNLVMLTILLLEPRTEFFQNNGVILMFGVNLFAFLYSVYLVYLQAEVIKAYCQWCLSHELFIALLFVVSTLRLVQSLRENS